LPYDLQEKENPNDRKPLKEIVMEVRTNGWLIQLKMKKYLSMQ